MSELSKWLEANQLDKYQTILIENDITNLVLLSELTEDDIKELGFSLGDRKRFIIGIKDLASNSGQLPQEDIDLVNSLPYVIAFPLKRTLEEQHAWTKINLFKDTFLNYLKYLGLLSASEFFNSDIKDKGMVLLFQQNLIETAFGKWNHYIRESLKFLKEHNHTFFCPELATYYELVETGNKSKKYKGEIEYEDGNGDTQIIVQSSITSIGMLINFRNRYLGHGLTLDAQKSEELWHEYFPIFRNLLEQLGFAKDYPMMKYEDGQTYLLHSSEITTTPILNNPHASIWIQNKSGANMDILPFFIVPGEVSLQKEDKEQMFTYESYTGKTIKFFSPEGTEKQTSGKLLEKLNLLLRDKKKEIPFLPQEFTKEEFLNRIAEENKLLLETLISEKKIIPGVYEHRVEMEIKLREWIGARANIFFIAAEAGSGKTNLLVEIQKQYSEWESPSLLIRAGRMEKQSLKAQIAYLLNIDLLQGLENYSSIAGTQAAPTFILIDGLNEANHAEAIWQEILSLSTIFEPGSLKFVVTNRTNTKGDLERYLVSDKEQELLYGENKENEKGLGAYSFWLTALDMKEMKGAWENYATKDKARFKPQFTFDAIAEFDRGIYNQINNPLILRLFLEIYNGKTLPKKGNKHLHIWNDWFKTFSEAEQIFFKLVADAVWDKGENELLLDDLLNHEILNSYFTSDVINAPYARLKNLGWISSYTKDLDSYVGFTVEGSLFFILGVKLQNQTPTIDLKYVQSILQTNSKLHTAAIETFLGEEALAGNFDLVSELIDNEDQDISICITPLVLFLKTFGVKATIEKVLANPTENDWKALFRLNNRLADLQLHLLRRDFLKEVMLKNQLQSKFPVWLALNAITLFDKEESFAYLLKIDTSVSFIEEDDDMLFGLGEIENKFGNFDKSIKYFEKCETIRLQMQNLDFRKMSQTYNCLGVAWSEKGEYESALEYFKKSLSNLQLLSGDLNLEIASCYNNIGGVLSFIGDYDKALNYLQKSLDIDLKLLGNEHTKVAVSYNNIGGAYNDKGYYDKSLEYYEKSLFIRLKVFGDEHPSVARLYNNIGGIWDSKGNYEKSLEFYKKALSIRLKSLGSKHPDVANSFNSIGCYWDNKGDYIQALKFYKKALAIDLITLGNQHPNIATYFINIGYLYIYNNNYSKALKYFNKSLSIRLKAFNNEHPEVASSYFSIGMLWHCKEEYEKALEYYQKSLDIDLKIFGDKHPNLSDSYSNIGALLTDKGDFLKSIEYYELSYSIIEKGSYIFQIANCYQALNNKDKALFNFIKSSLIFKKDFGLEDEGTQEAIINAKRLAKELNKESELPEWMK